MPEPLTPKIGFGMNVACRPWSMRDLLHDEAEGRDAVGRRHGVGVLEVDLVLAGRDLVVRRLDLEAHLLEREHDVAPRLFAPVDGGQVEVARPASCVSMIGSPFASRRKRKNSASGPVIIV